MLPLVRLLFVGSVVSASLAVAQQPASPATPYVPLQSDRPSALEGEETGFTSIFDGKTLTGWDGDPTYWRAEDGVLVGEITPETELKSNTFIIWRGDEPEDFELKLEYRITPSGNSGINYRSVIVADSVTPANTHAMRGYQCDIDGRNRYTGNNYEEKGRLFLAVRGQLTRVVGDRPPIVLSTLGDNTALASVLISEWNSVHLLVRGHLLVHTVNGQVMSMTIDDDAAHRTTKGMIGVQVHVGPPMKVEYRNIRLKTFPVQR
ncbi:MAG: DUF1080 domain-containing protein [Opitutus sp.]